MPGTPVLIPPLSPLLSQPLSPFLQLLLWVSISGRGENVSNKYLFELSTFYIIVHKTMDGIRVYQFFLIHLYPISFGTLDRI
ncbi:hypothetical protein QL285_050588 [Trifolium repens]|nr:hypothetical protein QL285_050588 [Trifolium repens]